MHFLEGVLSAEELSLIRQTIDLATFEDGRLTARGLAAAAKQNLQLKREGAEAEALDRTLIAALSRHPLFGAAALPKRFVAPLYSRYEPGMKYGPHVDGALMGPDGNTRSDLSVTVFLNDPGDYDGGELAIETAGGVREVKLPAGSAVMYSTYAVHQVKPVTRGQRLVAVTWIESRVRDPLMREVLFDLHAVNTAIGAQRAGSLEAGLLNKAVINLLRLVTE